MKETFLSSTKGSLVATRVSAKGGVDGTTREVVMLLDLVIVSGIECDVVQTSANENLERKKEKKVYKECRRTIVSFTKQVIERERCRKRDAYGD